MQTNKEILWEILPTEAPLYVKKCSKCKVSNHFYCSGKFRMNNQKKNSDVWLIYKCTECDNTFNVTILSRIKPHLIDGDIYEKFIGNDLDTALKLSLSQEIIDKNHIQVKYDSIEYVIKTNTDISLNDMIFMEEDTIEIKLIYPINLHLKLSKIIREKMGVSLSKLETMLEREIISIDPFDNLKREKLKDKTTIKIDRCLLSDYLLQWE